MRFEVHFQNPKLLDAKDYHCKDAGSAFAACQKEYPGATMVKCRAIGGNQQMGWAWTWYEAPPVQRDPIPEPRPPKPLKPEDKSCVLPFYDDVISSRD